MIARARLIVAATIALIPCPALVAQTPPSDAAIRSIIVPLVDAGHFSGIAVGLVSRDGRRHIVSYGPKAGVTPFDGSTEFEIGSITKTFTAAILADMVSKGEVALDDPVAQYLPDGFTVPHQGDRQITLLDLATQRSGLPRLPTNLAPIDSTNPYADYTADNLRSFLASYTLPRAIGAQYEYSNLGFGLLGLALAHKAGMSYEKLVTTRILEPLGMHETAATLTPRMRERLAPGHDAGGNPIANWDFAALAGAGALRSDINDMLTYIAANADSTSPPLGSVLALTHTGRIDAGSPAMQIGLAWNRIHTPSGRTVVWHNGGTGGYRSFTGYDEASGLGVVVLTNTSQSVDEIGVHLLDAAVPIPTFRTAITLPPEALERYLGVYELQPSVTITITRDGSQLMAQITGQPSYPVFAEAVGEFFYKVVDAQLSFGTDSSGAVTGLVLHQGGRNMPAKRK